MRMHAPRHQARQQPQTRQQPHQSISQFYLAVALLLLLLKELGDGRLLGVCRCLDLPACAKIGVAAEAGIPWPILVGTPAACQLPLALLPDARAAVRAGDLGRLGCLVALIAEGLSHSKTAHIKVDEGLH